MSTIVSAYLMGPDGTCRDKRSNVSGESMQSVEAGDLFETNIIPSFHVASYQCSLFTSAVSALSTPSLHHVFFICVTFSVAFSICLLGH
jgi:hypothetical protein